MTTKKFSLLGVVLGMIESTLVAVVSGAWMFWLALGVAIGLLLGNVNRRRNHRPNFGQGASI